jgi:hypothetical protein
MMCTCWVTTAMHMCGEVASRSANCTPSLLRGFTDPSRGCVLANRLLDDGGSGCPVCIMLVRRRGALPALVLCGLTRVAPREPAVSVPRTATLLDASIDIILLLLDRCAAAAASPWHCYCVVRTCRYVRWNHRPQAVGGGGQAI